MKIFRTFAKCAFLLAGIILFTERPAHAYLDAGTGSMIIQLLLGGTAGLAVLFKMFWQRLVSLFSLERIVASWRKSK